MNKWMIVFALIALLAVSGCANQAGEGTEPGTQASQPTTGYATAPAASGVTNQTMDSLPQQVGGC